MRMRNVLGVLLVVAASACASSAPASPTADLDEARRLTQEAKPHVEKANDESAPMDVRLASRTEAHSLLTSARAKYDSYLAKHPSETERLDKEYTDLTASIHWLKKDSRSGDAPK